MHDNPDPAKENGDIDVICEEGDDDEIVEGILMSAVY